MLCVVTTISYLRVYKIEKVKLNDSWVSVIADSSKQLNCLTENLKLVDKYNTV